MNENIDEAIKLLAEQISAGVTAYEAKEYAQAALNLAHTKSVLGAYDHSRKEPEEC